MRWERNPLDRRYPERLAGSTLASLVIHALLALLFVALVFSASEQGANENVSGEVVTIERRAPVTVANVPAATQQVPPVPHAPRIAPLHHAPIALPQAQRLPQNRHELARQTPNAPPNPRPIPQQTPQPNPQPTQNIYEVQPRNEVPAVPVAVATVAPPAVALKPPPSAAPSPAATIAPSAKPSPRPAATASPTAVPSAAAVAVRPSAAPSVSPAPAAHASAPPAPRAGVPSPRPSAPAIAAKTAGTAPSPGPKGLGSPGPHAGAGLQNKPAPARPIEVRPVPTPKPAPRPPSSAANNLNARLRALLPNNPVHPTSKQYTPHLSLDGRIRPTPPPDVLAHTKYIYRSRGGSEGRVVMWVTDARKVGLTTMCTGWLVRYPLAQAAFHPTAGGPGSVIAPANGTQLSIGGGAGAGYLSPIVDGIVTEPCEGRLLEPFAGSAAPSP